MDMYVSKAELAKTLGVSLPTVDSYIRKGIPVEQEGNKGIPWKIHLPSAIKWAKEQAVKDALGEDLGELDIKESQKRKLAAEAKMAQLALARELKFAIAIPDVVAALDKLFVTFRSRLTNCGPKLAPLLAHETDAKVIQGRIDEEMYDALTEFASGLPFNSGSATGTKQTDKRSTKKSGTPSQTESKRMGRQKQGAKPRSKRRAGKVGHIKS